MRWASIVAGGLMMMQDAPPSWIEAEGFAKQAGSRGADIKSAACGLRVLGSNWGAAKDHFAEYAVGVKQNLDARLYIRYARAMAGKATFDVFVDGERRGSVAFASTGGWGEQKGEWRFIEFALGNVKAGAHTIRFQNTADRHNVNLDGFFIAAAAPDAVQNPKALDAHWERTLPENLRQAARINPEKRKLPPPLSAIRPVPGTPEIPDRLRRLAAKPSPYLVKAYDAGGPTDFDRDVAWHVLRKEKDPRFFLAHAGKSGLVDLASNIHLLLDIPGKPEITAHLIDALFERFVDGDLRIDVAWVPVASDTMLAVVDLENRGDARTVPISFQARRPAVDLVPRQDYGYGATTTTGKLRWAGDHAAGVASLCMTDWRPDASELTGSMLCTIVAGETPDKTETKIGAEHSAEAHTSIRVERGALRRLTFAANLRRFSDQARVGTGGMQVYAVETEEQAIRNSTARAVEALNSDWIRIVKDSVRRYESFPVIRLPNKSWELAWVNCLELPLANTYSKCREMAGPFYTFCRAHAVEPYGWWSYGMHAHESLTTFVANLVRPELSQQWLLSHAALLYDDGELPYGVSPKGRRKHEAWNAATAPFIPWEAWTTYAYGGNKEFLELAFETGRRNHDWWLSKRTRTEVPLQHWLNFMESVRDDQDLDTWAATGGAEHQEALDLNCYLLVQEKVLERIARELGKAASALKFAALAKRRAELMHKHMLHDGLFFGVDVKTGKPVRVKDLSTFLPLWAGLATTEQAAAIVRELRDSFDTPFPVASLGKKEKGFGPQGHWRGSNWVQMSFLVMQGLRQYGYYSEAARLAEINARMVFDTLEKTGHFREYYNTDTGQPVDLTDYLWSSMPAAMIVEIIFGVRPTAEGVWILPALPKGWDDIAIDGLSLRGRAFTIAVRRGPSTAVKFNGHAAAVAEGRGLFVKWSDLEGTNTVYIEQAAPQDVPSAPAWPRIAE